MRIGKRSQKIVGDADYKKTFAKKVEGTGYTFECGETQKLPGVLS
jgi:hypothetical protein